MVVQLTWMKLVFQGSELISETLPSFSFQSTDVLMGVRKAKSRHDMDTAGVRVEIISLCMFTELLRFDTVT